MQKLNPAQEIDNWQTLNTTVQSALKENSYMADEEKEKTYHYIDKQWDEKEISHICSNFDQSKKKP